MRKKTISTLLFIFSCLTKIYSQSEVIGNGIIQFDVNKNPICLGDTLILTISNVNYSIISPTSLIQTFNNPPYIFNYDVGENGFCNTKYPVDMTITGDEIIDIQQISYAETPQHCVSTGKIIIKAIPKKTKIYSLAWSAVYNYIPPVQDISKYTYNISGDIEIIVIDPKNLRKPTFQLDEIIHPVFSDSKTIKLTVNGCDGNNQLIWLNGGGSGKTLIMNDPYNCEEYQVACTNGCDTLKSDVIVPSKNFHPTNSGYSQIFINHVNNQVAKGNVKGEKFYRKEYQCILNNSVGQSWGQGFVKYNFDYMATHLQCERSIEKDVNGSFYETFSQLGNYHVEKELIPAFSSYVKSLNTCADLDNWKTDHELFLNGAVILCFDNIALSPELNTKEYWILQTAKLYTLFAVRSIRDALIWVKKTMLNCPLNTLPAPLTKTDLFSSDLENSNILKVKAVIDTTFFVKTKSNLQLKITKLLADGSTIDLTNETLGTVYSISLDTNIVKVSGNGLLTIKRTDLPYSNNRLPFLIEVKNGSDVGYGQFAIYDTDIDNDYLADTYEEKEGLNPNVPNPKNLDTDQDGIEDFFELSFLTSPIKADTDGDGYSDI